MDDTGLTALDLARGRKMKATLKEAWTEATQSRQSTNLGPLKTPGREDTRLSVDDNRRRKGEVIFDVSHDHMGFAQNHQLYVVMEFNFAMFCT